MTKILNKLDAERMYINIIKATAKIIFNSEKLKAFEVILFYRQEKEIKM